MLRQEGRVLALACALALGAGAAWAGDETLDLGQSGVQARVRSAWPKSLAQGWAPILIELRNSSARPREVRFEASSWDWNQQRAVNGRLELGPGEATELELLVPVSSVNMSQYWLQLEHGQEQAYFGDCVGTNSMTPGMHPVLYVSERAPLAGELEASSAALGQPVSSSTAAALGTLGYVAVPSATGTPTLDVELAHARHADLARQWGAYTSLDLVVLDADHGLPPSERLAPLLAWVRSGGELLVIGERARVEAERAPELAAWMEARFGRPHELGDEYRCGLGRLSIGTAGAELDAYTAWIRARLEARALPVPEGEGPWRGKGVLPLIPGLDLLPFRTFALILIVFALAIGPVNFILVARRRKPVLLLLTIPATALLATLLLVGYGVLFQGLDVKTASTSIALLDERAHRSSSLEVRQLFAGLAPGEGLAPGAGTVVTSLQQGLGDRANFVVEYEAGLLLKGDYLPSRTPVHQVLSSERSERARLGMSLAGERLRIDNNLGADLLEFAVRTPEGRLYASSEGVPAGESVELMPAATAMNAEALVETLHTRAMPLASVEPESPAEFLPPGCYVGTLRASPFRDECGIELNELAGTHVLFGVRSLAAEDWR